MLGLDGFVLLGVSRAFGELEQVIETIATEVWCLGCGVAARASAHDYSGPSLSRSSGGARLAPAALALPGERVRGDDVERDQHRHPARSSLTERTRRQACRLVGEDQQDAASVAVMLGVGWGTVMRAVVEYGTPLVEDPARLAGVASIGVDETSFLAANRFHHTEFITGIVALARPRPPLSAAAGRHTRSDDSCCAAVDLSPSSEVAGAAVDDVRRRVQQQSLGRRGHRDDPLYRGRRCSAGRSRP